MEIADIDGMRGSWLSDCQQAKPPKRYMCLRRGLVAARDIAENTSIARCQDSEAMQPNDCLYSLLRLEVEIPLTASIDISEPGTAEGATG